MQLHLDPRSGASRAVLMFVHEHELVAAQWKVELACGQNRAGLADAPSVKGPAPMLIDGDLVLTRSPAVLRHLADQTASPTYPSPKRPRARVDAAMDWVYSELARYFDQDYLCARPHAGQANARREEDLELRWCRQAATSLDRLDTHLREEGCSYLCGDNVSIADYSTAGVLGLVDASGLCLARWPYLKSWLRLMKSRPSWAPTHFAVQKVKARQSWLGYAALIV